MNVVMYLLASVMWLLGFSRPSFRTPMGTRVIVGTHWHEPQFPVNWRDVFRGDESLVWYDIHSPVKLRSGGLSRGLYRRAIRHDWHVAVHTRPVTLVEHVREDIEPPIFQGIRE